MDYLVIPAYEPDFKLIRLIQKIKEKSTFDIVIVNDGSSPSSQKIFTRAKAYATVLTHEHNQGKGVALKTAFSYIYSLNKEAHIVTADADGQHKVWDILRLLRTVKEHPYQLILGVRSFTGDVPLRSRLGNHLTKLIFKQQTGIALQDTQTGLRGFSSPLLPFMLRIEGERYEYEMNMLLEAATSYQMIQVPIETIYLDHNSSSHFRPIQDGLRIYNNLLSFALSSLSSFVIDYVIYALMILTLGSLPIQLRILLANGFARIISSLFNFSANKRWVFNNQDSLARTGSSYLALSLTLFVFDTLLIQLMVSQLGLHLLFSKIIVGLSLFFLSWFIQKKFIFKERSFSPS